MHLRHVHLIMCKIILVDGRMSREKLAQILKRHAPKKWKKKDEEEDKSTLADVWPEGVPDGHEGNGSSDN